MHTRSISTPKEDSRMRRQIFQITKLSNTGMNFFSTGNPQQTNAKTIGTGRTNKSNAQSQFIRQDRNMKFRLQQIDKKIELLKEELHTDKMEVRQNIERCGEMRQQFVWNELPKLNETLMASISGLSKQIRINKASFAQRNNQIYDNCASLWETTENLRQKVFEIRMRIQEIDGKMGFKEGYLIEKDAFY